MCFALQNNCLLFQVYFDKGLQRLQVTGVMEVQSPLHPGRALEKQLLFYHGIKVLPFVRSTKSGASHMYSGVYSVHLSVWPLPPKYSFITSFQRFLGLNARKPVFGGLRTTKVQTSLRIRAV